MSKLHHAMSKVEIGAKPAFSLTRNVEEFCMRAANPAGCDKPVPSV